jgi:nucleotide-binding universal stress UspA family protein
MLRQVLIPLDTTSFTPAATRLSAAIARNVREALGRDAVTLIGLGIVDLDQIPTGRFASLIPRDQLLAEARDRAKSLLETYRENLSREGIAPDKVETRFAEGSPFQAIMHHHVFSDMVVMGASCCFPPVSVDYDTLANLYHRASRPILLTPEEPRPVETVVMVMDGTAPSSRMMYAFAHLNPFPRAKLLIARSRFEEESHHLAEFFARVQTYLENFKFQVEQHRLEGHMIEALPDLVRARNAGAIAIGVHAEHFLDKVRNPLNLARSGVQNLFEQTGVAVFTVH